MKRILTLILIVSFFVLPQTAHAGLNISYASAQQTLSGTAGAVVNTPTEFIFEVKGTGKKFILLDNFIASGNPADNRYFVMSYDPFGTRFYDTAAEVDDCMYNPEDVTNIGYYLNNDFLSEGNLPSELVNHIDKDKVWKTEPLTTAHATYEFTAGVSLIAQVEYVAYANKIGTQDGIASGTWGWWTRTKRSSAASMLNILCATPGTTGQLAPNSKVSTVRPVFYLTNDFFKNVAITLPSETMGISNVRQTIAENFVKSDLYGADYTDGEIDAMFAPFEPAAKNVETIPVAISLDGKTNTELLAEGEKLDCTYDYVDITNTPESGSTYQWYRSSSQASGFTKITGAAGRQYTMTAEDVGKYLKVYVTPSNGAINGKEVISTNALGPILAALPPVGKNASITGIAAIGKTLTASFDYSHTYKYPELNSLYEWFSCDTEAGTFQPISGATSKTFVVTPQYLNKYLKFSVIPKSDSLVNNTGTKIESVVSAVVITREATTLNELKASDRTNIYELLREFYDVLDSRLNTISENDLKSISLALYPLLSNVTSFNDLKTKTTNTINSILSSQNNNSGSSSGGTGSGGGGGGTIVIGSNQNSAPKPVVPDEKPKDDIQTDTEAPVQIGSFSDLDQASWAEESINYLKEKNFIAGMPDGKFAPNSRMMMIDFVKVVVDAFGYLDKDATCNFVDISTTRWVYPYAASASKHGIVNGIGPTVFGVHREVTREDMAAIIYRIAVDKKKKIDNGEALTFTDSDQISEYAAEAVTKLTQAGVINGFEDGSFLPKNYVTRAQAAKVIHKLLILE